MKSKVVLVVSDPHYFRDYIWDRSDEFINNHPEGNIMNYSSRCIMVCSAFIHHRSGDVKTSYYRIFNLQSTRTLRGMTGPAVVVRQEGFTPRAEAEVFRVIEVLQRGI